MAFSEICLCLSLKDYSDEEERSVKICLGTSVASGSCCEVTFLGYYVMGWILLFSAVWFQCKA